MDFNLEKRIGASLTDSQGNVCSIAQKIDFEKIERKIKENKDKPAKDKRTNLPFSFPARSAAAVFLLAALSGCSSLDSHKHSYLDADEILYNIGIHSWLDRKYAYDNLPDPNSMRIRRGASSDSIRRAVMNTLIKDECFSDAAYLSELSGNLEDAIALYSKAEHYRDATRVAEKNGNIEGAIDFLIQDRKFEEAGDLAKKNSLTSRSVKLYESAMDYYLKREYFCSAAELAKKLGDKERATELYRLAIDQMIERDHYDVAIKIAVRLEDYPLAFSLLEETLNFGQAAQLAENIGDFEKKKWYNKLEMCYRTEIGDYATAASCAVNLGEYQKAIELFELAGNFFMAGFYAESLGNFAKASEMFEKYGDISWAANLALKAGNPDRAIALHDESRNFTAAGNIARSNKDYETAIEMYTKAYHNTEVRISRMEILDLIHRCTEDYQKEDFRAALKHFDFLLKKYLFLEEYGAAAIVARDMGKNETADGIQRKILKIFESQRRFSEAARSAEDFGWEETSLMYHRLAMQDYKNRGEFKNAANHAERLGLKDKAISFYIQAEEFAKVCRIHKQNGDIEAAAIFSERAILHLSSLGKHEEAARIAEQEELFDRASELFEIEADKCSNHQEWHFGSRAGHYYLIAAKLAKRTGNLRRAALMFEKAGHADGPYTSTHFTNTLYEQAASLFDQVGEAKKAVILYELLKRPLLAAQIAEENGLLRRAFNLYLSCDQPEKVYAFGVELGRHAEQRGDLDCAINAFYRPAIQASFEAIRNKNDFVKAAELAERALLMPEAKALYERFDKDYFSDEQRLSDFQFRSRIAVSRLIERADFDLAIRSAGLIDEEYQASIRNAVISMTAAKTPLE